MSNFTRISIGIERDDGDFAILATLNNAYDQIPDREFIDIIRTLNRRLAAATGERVRAYARADTPDSIDLEGDERLLVDCVNATASEVAAKP